MSGLSPSLKRDLAEIDQLLEIAQGKLTTLAGGADMAGLPPAVGIHIRRKRGAIGHTRDSLRDDTPRIAAEPGVGQ